MSNKQPVQQHKLYIIIRNDLPSLNPGKAMAQAAHAANQFVHDVKNKQVKEWQKDGQGFGTTIVLSASIGEINSIYNTSDEPCDYVVDETYPYIVDNEIAFLIPESMHTAPPIYKDNGKVVMLFRSVATCLYLFLESGRSNELISKLPLYP